MAAQPDTNYFSIFMEQRGSFLKRAYFITHRIGDTPQFKFCEKQFWRANYNLAHWLSEKEPWLVNVDMDYFFAEQGEKRIQMFSDEYIEQLGLQIKEANDTGQVACITLAITPEMCGADDWEPGLHALRVFCRGLNLDLPDL